MSTFPRAAWLRSLREALRTIPDDDLRYGDPRGVDGAARGAGRLPRARARRRRRPRARDRHLRLHAGARRRLPRARRGGRAADRARGSEQPRAAAWIAARAGLEPVAGPGRRRRACGSTRSSARDADAVVLTPAHQHPTGAVLSGERRAALLRWLRDARRARDRGRLRRGVPLRPRGGRCAPGSRARPDRVRRVGEQDARAGAPDRLARGAAAAARRGRPREAARRHGHRADRAARVRRLPRPRGARPAPAAHAGALPGTARRAGRRARRAPARGHVRGIAGGLHATVELPAGHDESAICEEAGRRRIWFNSTRDYRPERPMPVRRSSCSATRSCRSRRSAPACASSRTRSAPRAIAPDLRRLVCKYAIHGPARPLAPP